MGITTFSQFLTEAKKEKLTKKVTTTDHKENYNLQIEITEYETGNFEVYTIEDKDGNETHRVQLVLDKQESRKQAEFTNTANQKSKPKFEQFLKMNHNELATWMINNA